MKHNKYILIIIFMSMLVKLTAQIESNCTFKQMHDIKRIDPVHIDFVPDSSRIDTLFLPGFTHTEVETGHPRNIVWIHGLGGDEYAWSGPMFATDEGAPTVGYPARNTIGWSRTYTTGTIPMDNCAYTMTNFMRQQFAENQSEAQRNNNMLIAHSQGCIVARTMNMNYDNIADKHYFGGIVFFDGPNNGADILYNARSVADGGSGLGTLLVQNACEAIANPIIKEKIAGLSWIKSLIAKPLLDGIEEAFCDEDLGATIFQYAIDGLAKQKQTDAFMPGAQHLKNLKNYEADSLKNFKTYQVNFYSKEPDNGYLVWRTLNYALNPSSGVPPFSANADEGPGTLKHTVDSLVDVYEMEIRRINNEMETEHCYTIWSKIWKWGERGKCRRLKEERQAFEFGIDFFETANEQWKVIVGAKKHVDECRCKVTLYSENGDGSDNCKEIYYFDNTDATSCASKGQELFDAGGKTKCLLYTLTGFTSEMDCRKVWREYDSDGVVTLSSQASLSGTNTVNIGLVGSSHMQIRNDNNTKESLKGLFDGNLEQLQRYENRLVRDYFKTETK